MNCLISIAKTNYMTISPNIPIIVNAGSNPVPSNKQVTATEPRSATSIIKLPMPSEEAAAQMLIDTGSPTSECYVEPLQIQFDITPATN